MRTGLLRKKPLRLGLTARAGARFLLATVPFAVGLPLLPARGGADGFVLVGAWIRAFLVAIGRTGGIDCGIFAGRPGALTIPGALVGFGPARGAIFARLISDGVV